MIVDLYGSIDKPTFWKIKTAQLAMAVAAVNCENAINAQPQEIAFNALRFTKKLEGKH